MLSQMAGFPCFLLLNNILLSYIYSPYILGTMGTTAGRVDMSTDPPEVEGMEDGTTTWATKNMSADTSHELLRASVG